MGFLATCPPKPNLRAVLDSSLSPSPLNALPAQVIQIQSSSAFVSTPPLYPLRQWPHPLLHPLLADLVHLSSTPFGLSFHSAFRVKPPENPSKTESSGSIICQLKPLNGSPCPSSLLLISSSLRACPSQTHRVCCSLPTLLTNPPAGICSFSQASRQEHLSLEIFSSTTEQPSAYTASGQASKYFVALIFPHLFCC